MERGNFIAVKGSAAGREVSRMAGEVDGWRGGGNGEGCHGLEEEYRGGILQGYGAGGEFLMISHEVKGVRGGIYPGVFGDNATMTL